MIDIGRGNSISSEAAYRLWISWRPYSMAVISGIDGPFARGFWHIVGERAAAHFCGNFLFCVGFINILHIQVSNCHGVD
jgi:hypothetical protein